MTSTDVRTTCIGDVLVAVQVKVVNSGADNGVVNDRARVEVSEALLCRRVWLREEAQVVALLHNHVHDAWPVVRRQLGARLQG